MNYLDYYELAQEPFSNAPVSRFYFNSPQHAQALVRLTHVCSQMKGLAILVGDIGAGKTTLARRLLDSLPENEYEAALLVIIHSGVTASWLLKRIALQLGVDAPSRPRQLHRVLFSSRPAVAGRGHDGFARPARYRSISPRSSGFGSLCTGGGARSGAGASAARSALLESPSSAATRAIIASSIIGTRATYPSKSALSHRVLMMRGVPLEKRCTAFTASGAKGMRDAPASRRRCLM